MISRKLVPLFGAEGQGSIAVPDSLAEGIYYIRAYTDWMLNFDEAFQYVHSFALYNTTSPQNWSLIQQRHGLQQHFLKVEILLQVSATELPCMSSTGAFRRMERISYRSI